MAMMAGGSLADRLEEMCRRGPRVAAAFVDKVARGVHAAHELGVLHRDLKPANILLDAKGEPRVCDFGLAKFWSPDGLDDDRAAAMRAIRTAPGHLTIPGFQPGTPSYMAPEQFDSTFGRVGPSTDVWALGVILFELVSGKRPFVADDDSPLHRQVCEAPTPRCRSPHYRTPRWLQDVVARCLAKEPEKRYASAAELATALRTGLKRGRQRAAALGAIAALMFVLATGYVVGRLAFEDQKVVDEVRV
jgi:serine/threonine-protein kinase